MGDVLIFTIVRATSQNLCLYNVTCVRLKKIQKSKKSAHVDLPFFIRKVNISGDLAIGGLK